MRKADSASVKEFFSFSSAINKNIFNISTLPLFGKLSKAESTISSLILPKRREYELLGTLLLKVL